MKSVVGLFDNLEQAYQAVNELKSSGFTRDHISVISRDANNEYSRYVDKDQMHKSETAENVGGGTAAGAGIGAVLGGLGGFLASIGALAIPGVGPIIAAGPILATLAGAGIGAAAGGIVGALVGLGIPEEEANYYAEGVRRGGTLVVVRTEDQMADRAADILDRFNPVDVHSRTETWRQNNWSKFDKDSQYWTADQIEAERKYYREHDTIPVTGMGDELLDDRDFNATEDRSEDIEQDYPPRRRRVYIYEEGTNRF